MFQNVEIADRALNEVVSRIDAAAEKLGLAANYAWPLLVKEYATDALVTMCSWGGVGLTIGLAGLGLGLYARKLPAAHEDRDSMLATATCFCVIGSLFVLGAIGTNLTAVLNPEAGTIRNLIGRPL